MKSKFNYDTGPYEGFNFETPAQRYLFKLDYNIAQRNKLSVRYNQLDSSTDVLASNSSVDRLAIAGPVSTALNFANNNYQILENIRSVVGELNSTFGSNKSNTFVAGYTYQDESRTVAGGPTGKENWFPFVEILNGGLMYTTLGFELFTPNNELRYKTFQASDSFSWYMNKHAFTAGASVEKYHSDNVFFPRRRAPTTTTRLTTSTLTRTTIWRIRTARRRRSRCAGSGSRGRISPGWRSRCSRWTC